MKYRESEHVGKKKHIGKAITSPEAPLGGGGGHPEVFRAAT